MNPRTPTATIGMTFTCLFPMNWMENITQIPRDCKWKEITPRREKLRDEPQSGTPPPRGTARGKVPVATWRRPSAPRCPWPLGFCGKHWLGKTRRESATHIKDGNNCNCSLAPFLRKNAYLSPLLSLTALKASESWLISHNGSKIQPSYWMLPDFSLMYLVKSA